MRQNIRTRGTSSEKAVKDIRRATRKQYSAEEKIRIVLNGWQWLGGGLYTETHPTKSRYISEYPG